MADLETAAADTRYYAEAAAPSTPSASQVATWADTSGRLWLKDDAGNKRLVGGFMGCRLYHNAVQSIANDTATALAFNTEMDPADTDAFHDTATNNSRITIPAGEGGIYELWTNIVWASNTTGIRTLSIRRNGSPFVALIRDAAVNNTLGQNISSGPVLCAAADYFEVVVRQTSGGALDVTAGDTTDPDCHFGIRRIA